MAKHVVSWCSEMEKSENKVTMSVDNKNEVSTTPNRALILDMLSYTQEPVDFVVNGVHFGRGDAFYDSSTSHQQKHRTLGLKIWKIGIDDQLTDINENLNHFQDTGTYLVEWHSMTDTFHLDSDRIISSHPNTVYFYWRGFRAPKGQSPLPAHIDQDTPVERLVQWSEPPVFLRLFSGTFVVHSDGDATAPRLYLLRGEIDAEAHLIQVPAAWTSLRSRTSFVLHIPNRKTIIWHGTESNSQCRRVVARITVDLFGSYTETHEGNRNADFEHALEGSSADYFSLLDAPSKIINYTPKLFYLTNLTGSLLPCQVENCLTSVHCTPFPFLQDHLYSALLPALFLLDDNDEIWLWHRSNDTDCPTYNSEYEQAKSIAIAYAKEKNEYLRGQILVKDVEAGMEPLDFTNVFPIWNYELSNPDGSKTTTNRMIRVINFTEN